MNAASEPLIDRARVAAALAIIAAKLSRGEIHADHSASMVALRAYDGPGACDGLRAYDGPGACDAPSPSAELFFADIDGEGPVSRAGDVLVGFRSNPESEGDAEVRLQVGPHMLGPVRVPSVGAGGFAYALDGEAVLPLVALAFHEVRVGASGRGVRMVQAHLDTATRRDLARFGGRHLDRAGRGLLIGSGQLHVLASASALFDSASHYHGLAVLAAA